MKRDILTKRTERGWASRDGRIIAWRDDSMLQRKKDGTSWFSPNVTRFVFWVVELRSPDGTEIWDEDNFPTLKEAEEQAWWFQCRIDEGRDNPDYDEEA